MEQTKNWQKTFLSKSLDAGAEKAADELSHSLKLIVNFFFC